MTIAIASTRGTYTATAPAQQTILNNANAVKLRSLQLHNTSASATVSGYAYWGTYWYAPFRLGPGETRIIPCRGYLSASVGVQLSCDLTNVLRYRLSYVDDVNNPAGGPTLFAGRQYYAPGTPGLSSTLWTPSAVNSPVHKILELVLVNIAASATYTGLFTVAGFEFAALTLGPGEGGPIQFEDYVSGAEALAFQANAPDNVLILGWTALSDLNNAIAPV